MWPCDWDQDHNCGPHPVVREPGVRQALVRGQPVLSLQHQQPRDEVLRRVGHLGEVGQLEVVVAGEGAGHRAVPGEIRCGTLALVLLNVILGP